MKIVVLDGYTMNPGDLSWKALESLGEVSVYDRTKPEEVIERIGDAEIVLTNKVIIDSDVISACPGIRYIGVLATGFNVVDLDAATDRGIVVTNAPGYSTQSVAQLVFAHILNFTHRVAQHSDSVKRGDWSNHSDFCYWLSPLSELQGKSLGLLGYGQIAQAVAKIALAFGMKVLMHKPNRPDELLEGIEYVDRKTLFERSDFLSLHCPLNASTQFVVNHETLGSMKSSAILINTGRGDLVNESDLQRALDSGKIAGAALDVTHREPIEADNPLLTSKNCEFTPHIGWATKEARERLMTIVADNVGSFLNEKPLNQVN